MKKISLIAFFISMCTVAPLYSGDFLKQFVKPEAGPKFFVGVVEEKQKQLEELKKEEEEFVVLSKVLTEKLSRQVEEVKVLLLKVEGELTTNPDDEFLIKQQSLLKESEQIIKDTQRMQEDCLVLLHDLIDKFMAFLNDPEFEGFKKKHKLQERLYYSFEDLQALHENILDYERRVMQLTDQNKGIRAEKESRKRSLFAMHDDHDKKLQDFQLSAEMLKEDTALSGMTVYEKEIVRLEEQLYKYKKNFEELRLKEINYKAILAEFQLFVIKAHLELFKKQLRTIKSAIHVSQADVLLAEEDLTKEQRSYFAHKDSLRLQHEKIVKDQKNKEKELNSLSAELGIPLGSDLDEWSKKPKQTADSYVAHAHIGAVNAEVAIFSREKDVLDAQIAFEEEKFNYKKIRTDEKKTYYKIATRGFLTEEEITKERTEYEIKKKDAEEKLKLYQTKINAVSNSLNQIKKILDKVLALREDADKQKDVIFMGKAREYTEFVRYLTQAEKAIKKQIDLLGKVTGIYSGIISELNSTIRLIDFISTELQASTIWYRPAYAITPEGIRNSISDIQAFFVDIRIYISQFNGKVFLTHISQAFANPFDTLVFVVKIIILLLLCLALRRYESKIIDLFFVHTKHYSSVTKIVSFIIGTLLLFIRSCYRSIFLWLSVGIFISMIPDYYITIIFYLVSIPYLLYLSARFIRFLMVMNVEYNYILLPEDFQRRFELVFFSLLYLSIIIFFFRQAFMLSSVYLRSDLPNILLAVNYIILQISLIFLITKEQIMGIIPERTDFWRWVNAQVDHYYYLILLFVVTIIIMCNPYVGFGRLVLYLLSGFVQMMLLLKVLSVMHDFVKRLTSLLLFSQEETVVRERFSYAKTCFGLIIIASFVLLGFIGFIVSAKIWGWDIGFYDLRHWISAPVLLEGTTNPITTISLLKLIAYVFGGFTIAYALKEYVLARIFDLLLVESGVQHTVTSIIQYIVIVVAVFIGFQSVGLGSLIGNVFIALALSIGLYIKDPISDFVSYFIILVQRPVKIGDYVQIDPETMGVVRKITPRAVILRRKNSTTIVVPNSYVVSKSIENWNYVRNFIAINDIMLFVYFKEDPSRVRDILQQAAEEHSKVLKNPRTIIRLTNFTESGYEFMVRSFISSAYTLEMWDIASDIRLLIAKAFRENDIEFAIPMYKVDERGLFYETQLAKERNKAVVTGVADSKTIKE